MNISTLSSEELRSRLRHSGLRFRTGMLTACVHSPLENVAAGIELLYADYPLAGEDFADFHVEIAPPRNLRRWLRPQVDFRVDGASPFKPLPADQAFPMFEWGLNWCVSSQIQDVLIIHAAVIERHGHAAVMPAPPGSGKSTLCAALIQNGWRLLSDELALVRRSDGALLPLPRPVSLKNASIDIMRSKAPQAVFTPAVRDTLKGTVAHMKPPTDSVARSLEPARPGWVIFPKYESGAATSLTPLPRGGAALRLADNAFNYSALGAAGFEALANLVGASRCYEFRYSDMNEAIAAFADLRPDEQPL
ncbi:HprK-related kinase A [Noviherbaspirillum pedocola]|uniref:HprK-related kinase A n=1 Tax=Noviherbaspirillum pedocola TaxID=2801341 RepID=A0A934SRM1_9BURK|nr:HprK-related kinase A [Noviherbaspirillum pedocola]MBK4734302.1 HprK-related kinase A [Noviherbaspirillum pedocola]